MKRADFRRVSTIIIWYSFGGGETMPEEYIVIFNAITDALKTLEELRENLILAQQTAEEIYISK